MARIEKYISDTVINDADKIIGTDGAVGANNATKNFTVGALSSHIQGKIEGGDSTFLKEKTVVLTLSQLSILNYGNTLEITIPEYGPNVAISVIQATVYLQAGQTPFNLDGNSSLLVGLGANLTQPGGFMVYYIDNDFINSTQSGYMVVPGNKVGFTTPVPLGSTLGIVFYPMNALAPSITEGDGTLTLKILYRIVDFS